MAAPIGPGDFVECVDAHADVAFRTGAVYRVQDVGLWCGEPWVTCVGMPVPSDYGYGPEYGPGWTAEAFRPIYRPSASLTTRLLEPVLVGASLVSTDMSAQERHRITQR